MRLSWRSVLGLIALASMRVVANEETSLQSAYVTSFKIYQKAIKIAHQRSLTPDQEQELDRILDEQPNIVYNTLSRIAGKSQFEFSRVFKPYSNHKKILFRFCSKQSI